MNAIQDSREYRIHWVRHGVAGTLDVDSGVPILPGELAGFIRERLSGRIDDAALWTIVSRIQSAAAAAAHTGPIDVHLPILERRRVRPWDWALESLAFNVAPGVVLVNETEPASVLHRRGYAESVIALACYPRFAKSAAPGAPNLVYSYTRNNATAADLQALTARYGIADPAPADGVETALTISIPGEHLSAWLISPRQVTNRFYRTVVSISAQLQQMLRAWLRFQWFSDLTNFNNLVASRAAIMYWLSAPHCGKCHSEFTYDVLALENVKKICRVGPRKFARELDIIHDRLTAAGMQQAAHCYRRLHTREIMDAVKREHRVMARMIAIESELVDVLINFAVAARALGRLRHDAKSATHGVQLVEIASDVMKSLRSTLRRFPVRGVSHDLAILTLIEATAQLRRSLGLRGDITGKLTAAVSESSASSLERNARLLPLAS